MERYSAEQLAVSLAGHDKGKLYLVLGREGDMLELTDGRLRPLDKPKHKKGKHVQLIRHLPAEIAEAMAEFENDADIRKILKQYRSLRDGAAGEQTGRD